MSRSQEDPALSGDGRLLAVITQLQGRPTVRLRGVDGSEKPVPQLRRHQPHSSPSLSWNGRYLALITQRGQRRLAVILDRLNGRLHPLPLPGGRDPVRLSLAPDARRLALQVADQGQWRVEVLDLSDLLEPSYGSESLRWAMIALVPSALALAGVLYLCAAKHLRQDLAAAPD